MQTTSSSATLESKKIVSRKFPESPLRFDLRFYHSSLDDSRDLVERYARVPPCEPVSSAVFQCGSIPKKNDTCETCSKGRARLFAAEESPSVDVDTVLVTIDLGDHVLPLFGERQLHLSFGVAGNSAHARHGRSDVMGSHGSPRLAYFGGTRAVSDMVTVLTSRRVRAREGERRFSREERFASSHVPSPRQKMDPGHRRRLQPVNDFDHD
jgi:hypothetical protein